MKYSAIPKKRSLTGKLTQIDRFGQPISLTFEGSRSFKTLPGALTTILITSLMLYFIIL